MNQGRDMGKIYRLRFLRDPTRLFKKKSLKNNTFLVKDHDFILSEAGWGCLKDLKKGKCEVVQSWSTEEHQITPFYSEETLLEAHPPPDVIDEVVAATMARRLRGHDCTPMYRGYNNIPNTFLLIISPIRFSWIALEVSEIIVGVGRPDPPKGVLSRNIFRISLRRPRNPRRVLSSPWGPG